jgi:hypothetical protein
MRKLILILALGLTITPTAWSQSTQEAMSIDNAIQELSRNASAYNKTNSFVSWHNPKDSTHGSALLFDNWPKGFILGTYDTVLKNPNLFFNYDKVTHFLYFTLDGKTFVKVETTQARELHFFDDKQTVLTRVDGIDPRNFFQRLSDSTGTHHYRLYRLIKTQLRRANYQTDGLVETGHNYDEYVDYFEYFLVMPGGREFAPLKLTNKSVRETLGTTANPWFAAHRGSKLDEAGLIDLVNTLNK